LARRPSARRSPTRRRRPAPPRRTHDTCAPTVRKRKRVERTLFRCEIHATLSTFRGWTAKRAATSALGQNAAVAARRTRKRTTAFAA
jgi:hypothetical protein